MKFFYLSTKCNFDDQFEIHERNCPNLPDILDRDYLGPFNHGQEALRKALTINKRSVTCSLCGVNSTKPLILNAIKIEET